MPGFSNLPFSCMVHRGTYDVHMFYCTWNHCVVLYSLLLGHHVREWQSIAGCCSTYLCIYFLAFRNTLTWIPADVDPCWHKLYNGSAFRLCRFVVSASSDCTARVWNLLADTSQLKARHSSAVTSLAVAPGGRTLTSVADDEALVWDVATGACLAHIEVCPL